MNRRTFLGTLAAILAAPKAMFAERLPFWKRPGFKLPIGERWNLRAADILQPKSGPRWRFGLWDGKPGPWIEGEMPPLRERPYITAEEHAAVSRILTERALDELDARPPIKATYTRRNVQK